MTTYVHRGEGLPDITIDLTPSGVIIISYDQLVTPRLILEPEDARALAMIIVGMTEKPKPDNVYSSLKSAKVARRRRQSRYASAFCIWDIGGGNYTVQRLNEPPGQPDWKMVPDLRK